MGRHMAPSPATNPRGCRTCPHFTSSTAPNKHTPRWSTPKIAGQRNRSIRREAFTIKRSTRGHFREYRVGYRTLRPGISIVVYGQTRAAFEKGKEGCVRRTRWRHARAPRNYRGSGSTRSGKIGRRTSRAGHAKATQSKTAFLRMSTNHHLSIGPDGTGTLGSKWPGRGDAGPCERIAATVSSKS